MQLFLERVKQLLREGLSVIRTIKKLPLYLTIGFFSICLYQVIDLTWKMAFPDTVNNLITSNSSSTFSTRHPLNNLTGDPFLRAANQASNQIFSFEAPPTTLSLKLYGIRYSDSGEADAAILGFDPNNQKLFITNEVIENNIVLELIEPERVVISRGGIRESVTFNKDTVLSPKVIKSLAKANTNKNFKDFQSNNVLNKTVSFKPYFSNGTLKGYQLYPGTELEFFNQSGLKVGDLLVAVNGLDVTDPALPKVFSELGQATLDVVRNDDKFSITLKLN